MNSPWDRYADTGFVVSVDQDSNVTPATGTLALDESEKKLGRWNAPFKFTVKPKHLVPASTTMTG